MARSRFWGGLCLVVAAPSCGMDAAERRAGEEAGFSGGATGSQEMDGPTSTGGGSTEAQGGAGGAPLTMSSACLEDSRAPIDDTGHAVDVLSQILWGQHADDALFIRGTHIEDVSDLVQVAREMLKDVRVRKGAAHFFPWWIEGSSSAALSTNVAPTVVSPKSDDDVSAVSDPVLLDAMRQEVLEFGADVLSPRTPSDLEELLTAPRLYVNDRLALHYELDGTFSKAFQAVDAKERFGIFSLAYFPSYFAMGEKTRPPARGAALRESLLCERIPGPPPEALQVRGKSSSESARQYFEEVAFERPECASCHLLTTEIGLGFEQLDAAGRFRSEDAGDSIDTTTRIYGPSAEMIEFEHPRDWLSQAALDPKVWSCFAAQWMKYLFAEGAVGGSRISSDALDLEGLVACSTDAEGRFLVSDFVANLAASSVVQTSFPCAEVRCFDGEACMLTGPEARPKGRCLAGKSCSPSSDCFCREGTSGQTVMDCTISGQ